MVTFALHDDIREALRRIRRNPRTSLLAVGTLALGIGTSTAVFTMAHTVLLAPPPYRQPEQIVSLHARFKGEDYGISGTDFLDYRKEHGLFEVSALAGYHELSWTGQSLPGFDGAEVLRGLSVTADYFRVLDQPMAAGRGFAANEDQPGHDQVVVISYSLWQRRFGGRRDIIGQSLRLNDQVRTVIGVAGQHFLPYESYEVLFWVPFPASTGWRDSFQYDCVARLATTVDQAQHRLDAINVHLAEAYPASHRGYAVTIEPLLAGVRTTTGPALWALAGAVMCLLLIASANVASLLLARATTQAREMAIRVALGAGRIRLYRMMLAESLMLALLAGVLGALIGAWLLTGAKALMPSSFQTDWMFVLDARVFMAAFLVSAFAGIVAGLAPAFESFRMAAGGLRPSLGRNRLLRGIVTAEIALTCLLLVGAGLLGKSFVGFLNRPLGYNTDHLLGMRVWLTGERYKEVGERAAYWSQLIERASAIPGVAKAASVSDLPMGWQYSGGPCAVRGQTGNGGAPLHCHYLMASPGYFATVGIPVLAGRGFIETDGPKSELVAIVSDMLASTAWPGKDPIGQEIKLPWGDERSRRVVGVVRRIRHGGPRDDYENGIYFPYRQINTGEMFLVLRTHVPPESVIAAVRSTLAALDPNVPAFEIRSMEKAFDREIALPRLPVVLSTVFASMAALLAGLGLFGVIAYWVSQRTKELGVRAALGAEGGELRRLVLRQGGRLALVGLAAGLTTSLVVVRYLRSLLYGMSEWDPMVYAAAIALAGVMVALACWLPAARAARVDPAIALREEG